MSLYFCETYSTLPHTGRTRLLHLICHVAIHVQRERGGSMAQIALHRFGIIPGPERRDRKGVPQVMEAGIRPADGGSNPFELPVNRGPPLGFLLREDII